MNNLNGNQLKTYIEKKFNFSLNKNQLQDIERLIYEIYRREDKDTVQIITAVVSEQQMQKAEGRNKFFILKDALLKQRFPISSRTGKIDGKKIAVMNTQLFRVAISR